MAEKKEGNIRYADVDVLFNNNFMAAKSFTLDIAHAYKVVQFKSRLKNAFMEIVERVKIIDSEVGIDDHNRHQARFNELLAKQDKTEDEKKELKEASEKNIKFNQLYNQLLEDKTTIEPKTMPYAEWRKFQEENHDLKNGQYELLVQLEPALEDILWKAPEGE